MSDKHTPGPWFYGDWIEGTKVESSASEWVDIWNIDADGSQGLPFVACKHHDEIANARLIAAAPDLLEACQTFAEWLRREEAGFANGLERGTPEGEAKWREWHNENLRLCDLAQTQARTAITKATGGTA